MSMWIFRNYFQSSQSLLKSQEIFLHGQCRVLKWNYLQGHSRMFQLIAYLKSNLMKADNHVHSSKSSGKDSRMYILYKIENKEYFVLHTYFYNNHIYYIFMFVCSYIADKQFCHIKLSYNMQFTKIALSPDHVWFSQMIMSQKSCIDP